MSISDSRRTARAQATAERFWLAFRNLADEEQSAVLEKLVEDEDLRRDFLDLATLRDRRDEPARPLREDLAERGSKAG